MGPPSIQDLQATFGMAVDYTMVKTRRDLMPFEASADY
jgi:hypothetical protein